MKLLHCSTRSFRDRARVVLIPQLLDQTTHRSVFKVWRRLRVDLPSLFPGGGEQVSGHNGGCESLGGVGIRYGLGVRKARVPSWHKHVILNPFWGIVGIAAPNR